MSYLHVATLHIGDAETTLRVVSEYEDAVDVFNDWWGPNTKYRAATGRWVNPADYDYRIDHQRTEELTENEADVLSDYLLTK